jgi:multimeric flavodoxin WrbA
MPIKVLAFASSPRRGGNSETLLDWLLASMSRESDVTVEKIVLVDADINPCRGCNACEKLNYCVQRDGMDRVHDKIIEADIIIEYPDHGTGYLPCLFVEVVVKNGPP